MPRKRENNQHISIGLFITGVVSLFILYTGYPFGLSMSIAEIWRWFWQMVFAGTILGLVVNIIKKKAEQIK